MALAPIPAEEVVAEVPAAPVDVMDEGAAPECIATICRNADGGYVLYAGDEPEPGMDGEGAEGTTFDSPQALIRGVMELLNPTEGAEASFGKAFRGEEDATAAKPDAPMGM